jgi:hypothetical protein
MQIITGLIVVLGSLFYTFYRLWRLIPSQKVCKILLAILIVTIAASIFIIHAYGDKLPFPVVTLIYNASPIWFYVFTYLAILFIVFDLINLLHIAPIKKHIYESWKGVMLFVIFVAIIICLRYIGYLKKERVEISIKTDKNIDVDFPIKIVAISDLNLGYGIGYRELGKWVQLINKKNLTLY